jgi:hypothetical protein
VKLAVIALWARDVRAIGSVRHTSLDEGGLRPRCHAAGNREILRRDTCTPFGVES